MRDPVDAVENDSVGHWYASGYNSFISVYVLPDDSRNGDVCFYYVLLELTKYVPVAIYSNKYYTEAAFSAEN